MSRPPPSLLLLVLPMGQNQPEVSSWEPMCVTHSSASAAEAGWSGAERRGGLEGQMDTSGLGNLNSRYPRISKASFVSGPNPQGCFPTVKSAAAPAHILTKEEDNWEAGIAGGSQGSLAGMGGSGP